MRHRIAILALAVGFALAPIPGATAADACLPCCPMVDEAPCGAAADGCASLSAQSCCDAPPVAPPSSPQRSVEAPAQQPLPASLGSAPPRVSRRLPASADGDLAVLTSPLRLSVVLII